MQHICDDFDIEVVKETNVVAGDAQYDDKLEGVTMVLPFSSLNITKLVSMLQKLGKSKDTTAEKVVNQPHTVNMNINQAQPKNVEVVQGDKEVIPSTSSYAFMDSIDKEALKLPHLMIMGVKELDKELQEFALGT